MYRLLMGNDKFLRKAITEISLNSYGFFEVVEADSVEDILSIINDNKPDIILINIHTSIINGQSLIKIINEKFDDIILIAICNSDEILQIKRSNKSVFDFIKNPIDNEELRRAIRNAAQCVALKKLLKIPAVPNKNNSALRNKLFMHLLTECSFNSELIYEKLVKFNIKFKFSDYFIAVFYFSENSKEYCKKIGADFQILTSKVRNFIEKTFRRITRNFTTFLNVDKSIVLVVDSIKSESACVNNFFYKLLWDFIDIYNIEVIIGASGNVSGINKFNEAYQEAYDQVTKQEFCGLKTYEKCEIRNEMFMEKKKDLIKSIYACNKKRANFIIDWICEMEMSMGLSVKQIKTSNALILNGILSVLDRVNCTVDEMFGSRADVFEEFRRTKSLEESKSMLKEVTFDLIEKLSEHNDLLKSEKVKYTSEYVSKNYNKNISLNEVAELFNIDSNSLGKMFREVMGITFSRYLINVRLQKAKELLVSTDMKVYEVGSSVGYNDVKYFTDTFKKAEGITPQNYRKKFAVN